MYNIYGSQLSQDLDVMYDVLTPLTNAEAKEYLSKGCQITFPLFGKEPDENICTISDGLVSWCYKGSKDEVNNMLYHTYDLHPQNYLRMVRKPVDRNVPLKAFRCVRIVLSMLSRTVHREEVKAALKSKDALERIDTLSGMSIHIIEKLGNKNFDIKYFRRKAAFQLGQTVALLEGKEIYTKIDMCRYFNDYSLFLDGIDNGSLAKLKRKFCDLSLNLDYKGITE